MVDIAQIEQVVKRMLGSVSVAFMAQNDGEVVSDGHRVFNFTGPGVAVADSAAERRVDVFIPGGLAGTTTIASFQYLSSARYLSLWNGSSNNSPPANWETLAFNDSGWTTPPPIYVNDGSQYGAFAGITSPSSTARVLFRQSFTLPSGTINNAVLNFIFDASNVAGAVYINGVAISGTSGHDGLGINVPTSILIPGGTNTFAVNVGTAPTNADMGIRAKLTLTSGGAILSDYVHIQDQKAQGTAGGTFTNGAWRTRTLNTILSNSSSLASLSSNQITLPAGTYRISARAPGFGCDGHQTRWQNVTDATTVLTGTTSYASNSTSGFSHSMITGKFTIAASKTFEFQHRCETTTGTSGLGRALNQTTEVYAVVELWKEG